MLRLLGLVTLSLFLSMASTSCIGYGSDGSDNIPYQAPLGVEDALVGVLWIQPYPLIFGSDPGGPIYHAGLDVANIGSNDIVIEKVTISGDPEIVIPRENLDRFPRDVGGDPECTGVSGFGFGIDYQPDGAEDAQAVITFHTNSSTLPTIEVPAFVDRSVLFEEFPLDYMMYGSLPLVKPNPIKLKANGNDQSKELCVHIVVGGTPLQILSMETIGAGLSIGSVEDFHGNTVQLPNPEDDLTQRVAKVFIDYRPESSGPLDGALVVTFKDGSGNIRKLAVPIVVR